jgi:glycosyltransferase involved in cell wall biosynthesis
MPRVVLLSQEIHPIPPLKGAAVEQWIDAVSHRLTNVEPHVVSVPHPTRPDDETDGPVVYHRVRVGRLYNRIFRKISRLDPYPYIRRVADYVREIGAPLVHLHNAPHFVPPLQEILPSVRLVLHMHNEKTFRNSGGVARLVGCSQYVADWYRQRGFPADKFSVIPNGVDLDRFAPGPTDMDLRRAHGIPDDAFVVLYVGRISPEKGVDRLVEAFRALDVSKSHLVLVGEWPQGDAKLSERVRFAATLRQSLKGIAHTVIDVVRPTEVHRYFHVGDIVVVPSRFEEPFSMVAIEAMACGVPVLAARKGGMTEYLRHGENALLFDAEAGPVDIANAISLLRDDRQLRINLSRAGRLLVTERFGWHAVADQAMSLYDDILGSPQ